VKLGSFFGKTKKGFWGSKAPSGTSTTLSDQMELWNPKTLLNSHLPQLIDHHWSQSAGSVQNHYSVVGEITGAIANAASGFLT
jgi:hypothetical protein